MSEVPPETRAEARRQYVEGTEPVDVIAARLGIGSTTIARWVRAENWPRRRQRPRAAPASLYPLPLSSPPPPARLPADVTVDFGSLAQRIFRLVDHNLSLMESKMNDEPDSVVPERDIRTFGDVLRSAEKMKDVIPGHVSPDTASASRRAPITPEEEDQLRLRIVERIRKIRERSARERGDS